MALIVEDGTIVAGAESYLSVADADTIITNRGGSSAWDALTLTQKEVQLRLGTEYIDDKYLFNGTIVEATQPLCWPRNGFTRYAADEIPIELKKALAVLANATISTELYVNLDNSTGALKSSFEKLDVIESKVEYYSGGNGSGQPVFSEVDTMLKSLTASTSIGRS